MSAIEYRMRRANGATRANSNLNDSIVNRLLGSENAAGFFSNYFGQRPYAAQGRAREFEKMICWDTLHAIFQSGHDECFLAQNGRLTHNGQRLNGRLTLMQALLGFADGGTVFVRHSERAEPSINEIATDFENLFGCAIDVQLYCTPADREGFDWHYDTEDVFVIQSQGAKEFRLRQNCLSPLPLTNFIPSTEDELLKYCKGSEIRCLLHQGDWLYIPPGYWHKARAITDSFHLSVGVSPMPYPVSKPTEIILSHE